MAWARVPQGRFGPSSEWPTIRPEGVRTLPTTPFPAKDFVHCIIAFIILNPTSVRPAMIARFVPQPGRLVMPDVRCDLAWVDERVILIGPMTHATPSRESRHPIVVASFDPIAVRGWLNIPLHLITDRSIPLADIEPTLARSFAEKFFAESTEALALPGERAPAFKLNRRLAWAVAKLRYGATVRATAAAVEYSERQLERVFQSELGLTPKLFARIVRLRRGLAAAKSGATLASAAANAGYADQSHFTRETQAFMRGSPSSLLQNVGNVQDILHGKMAD